MSDITVEQKLELMRQIRARNEQNRFDMARREQILYGKTELRPYPEASIPLSWSNASTTDLEEEQEEVQTFPLRILLSLGLFLMIIISDISGERFLGIQAKECFEVLAQDYESSITEWVDAASKNNFNSDNIEPNPPAGSRP